MKHILRALAGLTQDGVAFALRLYKAAGRTPKDPHETLLRDRTNYLLYRALLALRHIVTLTERLTADPFYRGEPARPTRPGSTAAPISDRYQWSPAPPTTVRRLKPRRFAQVFAGRSVGQIVDHLRHHLGFEGCVAELVDQQLAKFPPPEAEPKPKAPRAPFSAYLRRASPSLIPPPVDIAPGTGPPC